MVSDNHLVDEEEMFPSNEYEKYPIEGSQEEPGGKKGEEKTPEENFVWQGIISEERPDLLCTLKGFFCTFIPLGFNQMTGLTSFSYLILAT